MISLRALLPFSSFFFCPRTSAKPAWMLDAANLPPRLNGSDFCQESSACWHPPRKQPQEQPVPSRLLHILELGSLKATEPRRNPSPAGSCKARGSQAQSWGSSADLQECFQPPHSRAGSGFSHFWLSRAISQDKCTPGHLSWEIWQRGSSERGELPKEAPCLDVGLLPSSTAAAPPLLTSSCSSEPPLPARTSAPSQFSAPD